MKINNSKTLGNNTWAKVLLSIACYLIVFILISIIFNADKTQFIKMRIANLSIKIAIILIACFFTKYIDKRDLSFLGVKLEHGRSFKLFFVGCLIILVQLILIDTAAYIFKFIDQGSLHFSWQILFMGVLIFLIHTLFTAVSEEMLFRGYILGNLLTKYNERKAVIISSVLFTAIHFSSQQTIIDYIDIFLMGIIFAELYVISKSLYLPIGVHFFSDFIQEEVVRNIVVNENPYAIIKFDITNDLMINGSNLGPGIEFLFVISEVIILAGIYFYKRKYVNYELS